MLVYLSCSLVIPSLRKPDVALLLLLLLPHYLASGSMKKPMSLLPCTLLLLLPSLLPTLTLGRQCYECRGEGGTCEDESDLGRVGGIHLPVTIHLPPGGDV